MDVIEAARTLGRAIQADARYTEYMEAKQTNDADSALQGLIGKLSLLQMSYQNEAEKETPDHEKLDQWENEFQNIYGEIMLNPNMRVFEEKKQAVDDLMSYIVNLLGMCANGEDPDTAEPQPNDGTGCTGSCSSCGGCG